jgi:hypothetical protein
MRTTHIAPRLILLLGVALPARAMGQTALPPTTDVFSTLSWITVAARHEWRGLHRGNGGLEAAGAASWGGIAAGDWRFTAVADARTAAFDRGATSDFLSASALGTYQISDDGAWLWGGAAAYALPSATIARSSTELLAGFRVPVPVWPDERRPVFFLENAYDMSRYRAHYLRGTLRLDYKFAVRWGAMIDLAQSWSGYGGESGGRGPFTLHATHARLTLLRQLDPAGARRASFEPFVERQWTERRGILNMWNGGLRIVRSR